MRGLRALNQVEALELDSPHVWQDMTGLKTKVLMIPPTRDVGRKWISIRSIECHEASYRRNFLCEVISQPRDRRFPLVSKGPKLSYSPSSSTPQVHCALFVFRVSCKTSAQRLAPPAYHIPSPNRSSIGSRYCRLWKFRRWFTQWHHAMTDAKRLAASARRLKDRRQEQKSET